MSWKHLEDESIRDSFYRFLNVGSLLGLQHASILLREKKTAELKLGQNFIANVSFTEKKGVSMVYLPNK